MTLSHADIVRLTSASLQLTVQQRERQRRQRQISNSFELSPDEQLVEDIYENDNDDISPLMFEVDESKARTGKHNNLPSKQTQSRRYLCIGCWIFNLITGLFVIIYITGRHTDNTGDLFSIETQQQQQQSNKEKPIQLHDVCKDIMHKSIDDLLMKFEYNTTDLCMVNAYKCRCQPTIYPQQQTYMLDRWNETMYRNIDVATNTPTLTYDVIFYGDSITEHWLGTDLADWRSKWQGIKQTFQQYFNKSDDCNGGNGTLNGLALGIGGDRCGQLLYRLDHGELPDTLDAKIFWILIGTNDMGADKCNAESVAAGNIKIAQTIKQRRPNSIVVLNSILPRGSKQLGQDIVTTNEWQEISKQNQWLECYAASTEGVEFFNATDLFLYDNFTAQVVEYFADGVHPSAEGCVVWAEAMSKKIHQLIKSEV